MRIHQKFIAFYSIILLLKNWFEATLIYFNLIKKPTFYAKCRSGLLVAGRNSGRTSDIFVIHELFYCNAYDQLPYLQREASVIIDIGANIGCFSLYAAKKCPNATIYAFEPSVGSFKYLEENICANGLQDQIKANNLALSKSNGESTFYISTEGSVSDSLYTGKAEGHHSETIKVKTTTLQSVLEKYCLSSIDLVKMDCEGAEYDIIYNCPDRVFDSIQHMIIETHTHPDHKSEQLLDFLKNKGFAQEKIVHGDLFYLKNNRFSD